MKKRSHRQEKMANVYDQEILPIWSERFGRMLLRGLEIPPKSMVLDIGTATGFTAIELIKRMDEQSRLIAIDSVGPLLDQARKKAGDLSGKRIYFRTEPASSSLSFADEVYDVVISNLGLIHIDDPQRALQEFARVTKHNGQVAITIPLCGTYAEFYDIYREVLIKNDLSETLAALEQYIAHFPEPEDAVRWMENAGLADVEIEVERFDILFKSSREFFFAPLIEYGPLSAWKEIAGKGQEMQDIFWQIKEAIDFYYKGRAFSISVHAACLRGKRPQVLHYKEPLPIEGDHDTTDALHEVTRSGLSSNTGRSMRSVVEELVDLLPDDDSDDLALANGDSNDEEVTRPRESSYPQELLAASYIDDDESMTTGSLPKDKISSEDVDLEEEDLDTNTYDIPSESEEFVTDKEIPSAKDRQE